MSNYDKLKVFLKRIFHWVIRELKDWHTLVLFLIVCLVMYLPVIIGYGVHLFFKNPVGSVIATAYVVFWAGPFTPFFPLCLAITLFLKRIGEKKTLQDLEDEDD